MTPKKIAITSMAVGALALAGCGGSSNDNGSSTSSADTSTSSAPAQTTAQAGGCQTVQQPQPAARKAKKPSGSLDASKTWTVTMKTNCGSFSFKLDVKDSPKAGASIVSLVKQGYFDKTVFHRIVPGFVIQGGDPTATGTGGPGYKTVDPPKRSTKYPKGTVAMAKAGNEPAGAAGSQFFVVTSDQGGAQLTPDYAVVGHITKGMDVIDAIGKLGNASEQPTQIVEIEKATVTGR